MMIQSNSYNYCQVLENRCRQVSQSESVSQSVSQSISQSVSQSVSQPVLNGSSLCFCRFNCHVKAVD